MEAGSVRIYPLHKARMVVNPWIRYDVLERTRKMRTRNLAVAAILLAQASEAIAAVYYVNASSTNPVSPFATWASAAITIQDAVDVASAGDEVVVADGIYARGGSVVVGTLSNRVAVTKPLTVRSLNGPQSTIIQGYQVPGTLIGPATARCVYLVDGASLSGFTLTGGATSDDWESTASDIWGGGVWCDTTNAWVTNCVLRGNGAIRGGGISSGMLNNCMVVSNTCADFGGVKS